MKGTKRRGGEVKEREKNRRAETGVQVGRESGRVCRKTGSVGALSN